jgi:Preprotein translocase subunit SecA (ATPase, RNA helicase)
MRIFASEKVSEIMKKLGMKKGEAIEHKWVSKSMKNAQKRVEAHNFDIRKTLLEFDDISNEQRKVIYNQRDEILSSDNMDEIFNNILEYTCDDILLTYLPEDLPSSQWDLDQIDSVLKNDFLIDIHTKATLQSDSTNNRKDLKNTIKKGINDKVISNLEILDKNDKEELMRNIFLSVIDEDWRNHLNSIDYLRQGIGLRSYAQKNPKNEYKRESFEMFEEMLSINNHEIIKVLCKIKIKKSEISDIVKNEDNLLNNTSSLEKKSDDPRCLLNNSANGVSRNTKCPVTNKKFKQCCGRL